MADNDLNLASLWLPLMPSTAGLGDALKKAGREGAQSWQQGFGEISDKAGSVFGQQFGQAFSKKFGSTDFGGALSKLTDTLGSQVDAALASKLKGALPQLYREAARAADELRAAEQKATQERQRSIAAIDANSQAQVRAAEDVARATELAGQALARERAAVKDSTLSAQELNEVYRQTIARNREMIDAKDRLRTSAMQQEAVDRAAIATAKTQHEAVAAATEKATVASETLTSATERYTAASASAFRVSGLLAGAMGGAMVLGVQAVTSGLETLAEAGEHIFEGAIEGAREFIEKTVEVGEQYDGLKVKMAEFSGASGDAFDELNDHASRVFGQLDVAGKDFGRTYAQLHSMLDLEPGPALDTLARNVEDLSGRFTNLKAQDIASVFIDLKVPADQFNSSLDTMVSNAQNAGVGLGDLVSNMKGPVSDTLSEAGLNLGPDRTFHRRASPPWGARDLRSHRPVQRHESLWRA